MDSSFPSYKGFFLKGQRKSEETYNGKKFNNHVIIIILSVCLLWSTNNFFCMFECTSRTRTLSMFECIMFALWVWEQRNPIARTIENRDANQLPSICHSSTKKWAQTQVSTSQQSKRDTWILFKFLNNLAALAIKGTYFQYPECLQWCIGKLSTKD